MSVEFSNIYLKSVPIDSTQIQGCCSFKRILASSEVLLFLVYFLAKLTKI